MKVYVVYSYGDDSGGWASIKGIYLDQEQAKLMQLELIKKNKEDYDEIIHVQISEQDIKNIKDLI